MSVEVLPKIAYLGEPYRQPVSLSISRLPASALYKLYPLSFHRGAEGLNLCLSS